MAYARIVFALPLVLSCSSGPDSGSDASVTDSSSSSSGTQTGSGSSGSSTSAGPATTTGSSTDATTSGSSSGAATTGAELPPLCTKTSQCGPGKYCLQKDCEDVDNEPGCGELRCYSHCSSPFDESGWWHCADMQACCGGYPCEGGQCTEHFEPTEGG